MYILAQSGRLENCQDNIYQASAPEKEAEYQAAGYQRHERSYKIRCNHKEYTVICPEYRKDQGGGKPDVVIPVFLVLRRPYPLEVYLYAISLYSGNPEKGQRWAAQETRKYFGLSSFSHTTLGRALKAFVAKIAECEQEPAKDKSALVNESLKAASGQQNGVMCELQSSTSAKPAVFPCVQSTKWLREQAAAFLRPISAWSDRRRAIGQCHTLARQHFVQYQRFLL